MKLKAKKECRDFAIAQKRTGGGPPSRPVSDLSEEIKDLLPHEFAVPVSPSDDDNEDKFVEQPLEPEDPPKYETFCNN